MNFTLAGNVTGIVASSVKLSGITITGGDYGVSTSRGGKAAGLSVTGMTTYGVSSQRGFRFVDSTVAGNGYDVLSYRAPRLTRSSCDTSARLVRDLLQPGTYDIDAPWGVCAKTRGRSAGAAGYASGWAHVDVPCDHAARRHGVGRAASRNARSAAPTSPGCDTTK